MLGVTWQHICELCQASGLGSGNHLIESLPPRRPGHRLILSTVGVTACTGEPAITNVLSLLLCLYRKCKLYPFSEHFFKSVLHTLRMSLILPSQGLQSGGEARGCNVPVRNVSALRMLPLKTREGNGESCFWKT